MAKILITGGAGFIGSYLSNALSKNNEIFILDNFSSGTDLLLKRSKNITIYRTAFEKAILEKILKYVDLVIHLASIVGVDITIRNFNKVIKNLYNTRLLTELCKKYSKPIIFTSSSDVYGLLELIKKRKFKENDFFIFEASNRWNYGHIKCLEENVIKLSNLPFIIFRVFNTYGFGIDLRQPSRVFSNFLYGIVFKKPLIIYGSGNQKRAFCYIEDIVNGFILGISYLMKNKCKEIFNIGNDKEIYTINQLKDLIIETAKSLKILKNGAEVIYLPHKERGDVFTDIEYRRPNLTKIKKYFGYEPKIPLKKGIELSLKEAMKYKKEWANVLKEKLRTTN